MTILTKRENGATFTVSNDPVTCYDDVDIVISRNWISPQGYSGGKQHKEEEIERALSYSDWWCTEEKMKRTNNGKFNHPMPVDRGSEVSDEVASGPRSIIYDVAENRLHIQKALMALTMADDLTGLLSRY